MVKNKIHILGEDKHPSPRQSRNPDKDHQTLVFAFTLDIPGTTTKSGTRTAIVSELTDTVVSGVSFVIDKIKMAMRPTTPRRTGHLTTVACLLESALPTMNGANTTLHSIMKIVSLTLFGDNVVPRQGTSTSCPTGTRIQPIYHNHDKHHHHYHHHHR